MFLFSRFMRFFGEILTSLEIKYTSEKVGIAMMILSNTLYLVPSVYVKLNPHIDWSIPVMVRGLVTMIIIY